MKNFSIDYALQKLNSRQAAKNAKKKSLKNLCDLGGLA